MTDSLAAKLADNRQWLLAKLREEPKIDCTGCGGKCCYDRAVFLYPEAGDADILYDTEPAVDVYWGGERRMLKHKPPDAQGRRGCIYLSDADGKCSIWRNRPIACRAWSCVTQYGLLGRIGERRLKRENRWRWDHEEGKRRVKAAKDDEAEPSLAKQTEAEPS